MFFALSYSYLPYTMSRLFFIESRVILKGTRGPAE